MRPMDRDGWTLPTMVAFRGTVPLRLDTDTTDIILIAITSRGRDNLCRKQFTVTDEDSIPPGPIGQDTTIGILSGLIDGPAAASEWRRVLAAYFRKMSQSPGSRDYRVDHDLGFAPHVNDRNLNTPRHLIFVIVRSALDPACP